MMRTIIAALLLIPVAMFLQLSQAIDPEPGAELMTRVFRNITDQAGMKLVEK